MNADNRYGNCCNCPARMSDGRIFTNWVADERINYYIQSANNIYDSTEYRLFLQSNADKLMNTDLDFLNSKKRCNFTALRR